jgi:hypothetical protein
MFPSFCGEVNYPAGKTLTPAEKATMETTSCRGEIVALLFSGLINEPQINMTPYHEKDIFHY